jgi:hypothetical protein
MPSIKLSVTLDQPLAAKYGTRLPRVRKAVAAWIAADAKRGITVLHVALDSAAEMAKFKLKPLTGKPTAGKVKTKIDQLWRQLSPDYLVLLGARDVVPMFEVPNPSYDPNGDDDPVVPTDNPYACSKAFRAQLIDSYLVPDRVVGRIPDMVGDGDPAWFEAVLKTARQHKPRPAGYYAKAFAICCDEWKGAGLDSIQYIGLPGAELHICPPDGDSAAAVRTDMKRTLHMIKCHGAQLDPNFYGQKGSQYPVSVFSGTLAPRIPADALPAAMCCYGAQVYHPSDPAATQQGCWPIASTYLRQGAVGFAGSTMIAWVGVDTMMCADWIVAQYLKAAASGASLGRAFLESKQDYLRWITQQGHSPDVADQKTLVEFVLLGDPSLHPVQSTQVPLPAGARGVRAAGPVVNEAARRQRREFRAALAGSIRSALPDRKERAFEGKPPQDVAAVVRELAGKDFKAFGMAQMPKVVEVSRPASGVPTGEAAPAARRARGLQKAAGEAKTYEYYWTGRREQGPLRIIRLVRVEADAQGRVLRSSLLHSSRGIERKDLQY